MANKTTREVLHRLVDELPEPQAELARVWLEDLRDAADSGGPPLDPETLASLERGLADIPITELERLGLFLGVTLNYFLGDTVASQEPVDAAEAEKLARLPKDLRRFVLDPGNLPYLRMAVKFSDLPSDKLKELGEILLVVR